MSLVSALNLSIFLNFVNNVCLSTIQSAPKEQSHAALYIHIYFFIISGVFQVDVCHDMRKKDNFNFNFMATLR